MCTLDASVHSISATSKLLFKYFSIKLLLNPCGPSSSRSPCRSGAVRLGHGLVTPRPAQSSSWIHCLHIYCNIYCMPVCPGREIPPLWLFLRFLPSFFFPLCKEFIFQHGTFFLTRSKGLKDRGCCSLYRSQSPLRQCDCDFQAILVKLICFPPSLCLPQQVQHEENRTLLSHFLQKFPWLNHSQICSKWFFFLKENNYVLILVVSADQTQINDSMKPANDVFYKEAKKNPCLQRRWLVVYF